MINYIIYINELIDERTLIQLVLTNNADYI